MTDDAPETDRLVTYGSLLSAFSMQERLGLDERLAYEGPCRISGQMYDCGRYPGVVPGEGSVQGELYRLRDTRTLRAIDHYEGYDPSDEQGSLFVRRRTGLIEPDDHTAWVYYYNGAGSGQAPNRPRVPSGDWAEYAEDFSPAWF